MLWTPWRRTSSAMSKAFLKVIFCSETNLRRSFGITTKLSTHSLKAAMPDSACVMRFLPSNPKGFVTIPTVSIPSSLAMEATTGAAPVPVPPPMPAVMKIISAVRIAAVISSRDSSAAALPLSGLPPAPIPDVVFSPIWIFWLAFDLIRAALSVLIAINSTPRTPASTMRLTAFPPPPPTPTTLIWTTFSWSSATSNGILNSSVFM